MAPRLWFSAGRRAAAQRARELLDESVGEEQRAMYRDLGFIRVWGNGAADLAQREYAYLIYPFKPVVTFIPATGRLLHEYAIEVPGGRELAAADDVLARWMAVTGDELALVARAGIWLAGHEHSRHRLVRDVWRLRRWERARL